MGSLRAVSGGVEASMFQDEGAPDSTGTSRTVRPQLPPLNSLGWVRAEPNAHAVAPSGPSAPTKKSDTPKAGRNLQASLEGREGYRRLYCHGHPTPL